MPHRMSPNGAFAAYAARRSHWKPLQRNGLVYEIAIGSLDNPDAIDIDYHANVTDRLDVVMHLEEIPEATTEGQQENNVWNACVISNQHPDHDTDNWTVKGKQ